MSNRYIVIMAGGRGERFWPLSRLRRPKHLLPIVGDQPMISQTLARIGELVPPDHTLVVTNCEQRQAVLEILPQLPPENIVGEPMARDTAAAVGLSAVLVGRLDPQAACAILPSDHVIQDEAGFGGAWQRALKRRRRSRMPLLRLVFGRITRPLDTDIFKEAL